MTAPPPTPRRSTVATALEEDLAGLRTLGVAL